MCSFGLNADNFNPSVLYVLKRKFDCNSHTEYHLHDFVSMIYILSGSCTYKIDDRLFNVKKGDLIICNPGVMHGKIISDNEEVTEFHAGVSNLSIGGLPQDCLITPGYLPVFQISKYEHEFFRCCNEIMSEQEGHEAGYELILKTLIMRLVIIFLKELNCGNTNDGARIFNFETYDKTAIVNSIVTYINENYMEQVSLEKISRSMYLSPVYISKIFKEETGESPINYLIKVRLSKASDILKSSRKPIKAVAKCVGYEDAYHFSKLFKKYYGNSPSLHRFV